MADITPDMFSSDIQALPNFQALLDRFRASPRLVQDIIDFTKGGKRVIQLSRRLNPSNQYNLPANGQPGTIELNPSELGSPDLAARNLAHELGHALRKGGSDPTVMQVPSFHADMNRALPANVASSLAPALTANWQHA
jgi:hypothetical protein